MSQLTKKELQKRIDDFEKGIKFWENRKNLNDSKVIKKNCDSNIQKAEEQIAIHKLALAQLEEKNELKSLKEFKSYFEDLYGQGLEVANWHQNGDTEPFDSFFESALDAEIKALREESE